VVRWTAPSSAPLSLVARFLALDTGSSIVRIYHDGQELWWDTLENIGSTADCSLPIPVAAGDVVDVVVDAISVYDDSVRLDLVRGAG
jgi:hypothetical protein